MAKVDPFIVPLPSKLARDPDLGPYFQYLQRFLHDLWNRTGAGSDLVASAVTLTDLTNAISVHTGSANNVTDAELLAAIAGHTASADNTTDDELGAAIATEVTDRDTAISSAVAAHVADIDPHPGLFETLGSVAAALPQIADDFADDTAAATGGIAVGALYHTSGAVKVRLS